MALEATDNVVIEGVEDQKKIAELTSEGKKLLISGNKDLAIDRLSEAARLGALTHGEFGPEMYKVYLSYGQAQLDYANDLNLLVNQKTNDEAESSDEEEEENENAECQEEGNEEENMKETEAENDEVEVLNNVNGKATEKSEEGKEVVEHNNEEKENGDENTSEKPVNEGEDENADEEPQDALSDMVKGAWEVLELARKVAEQQLAIAESEDKIKEWKLRQAEANFFISQVLMIDEEFDRALEELDKALEVKSEFLSDIDRELAEVHFHLGQVHNAREDYVSSAASYRKSAEVFQKRLKYLKEDKTEERTKSDEAEVNELESLCHDVQLLIQDANESEKLHENVKKQLRDKLFGHEPVFVDNSNNSAPINDISELVRKRKRPQTGKDEKGDQEKKAKAE